LCSRETLGTFRVFYNEMMTALANNGAFACSHFYHNGNLPKN